VGDVVTDGALEVLRGAEAGRTRAGYFENLNKYRDEVNLDREKLHQKGKKVLNSLEVKVNMDLNNSLNNIQKVVGEKVAALRNNIHTMIAAKSKGSETNLAQIMFCLGNQNVDGKRLPLGFAKRSLPHFRRDDNSPEPRGYVFSSFFAGLKPHEFFFHSMGGREGLSDTAVKTSSIGYIQRKLVKSLEDIVISYDGTVRDSKGNLLQKLYGEDGFLSEYIETHAHNPALAADDAFRARYAWEPHRLKTYGYADADLRPLAEEYAQLADARDRLRRVFTVGKDKSEITYHCPINFDRLIRKILNKFPVP
jgi:DNA-directed RNA polymerase II subunit RPB1